MIIGEELGKEVAQTTNPLYFNTANRAHRAPVDHNAKNHCRRHATYTINE